MERLLKVFPIVFSLLVLLAIMLPMTAPSCYAQDDGPANAEAADSDGADSDPADSDPADSDPADSDPADSDPADSEAADSNDRAADDQADESRQAEGNAKTKTKTKTKPAANTKPRGRLPMYYAKVVNQQQREQIYDLQANFDQQIADLMAQVHALEMQRDEEIAGVLTPDQQAQVAEMVDNARKRRAAQRRGSSAREVSEEASGGETAGEPVEEKDAGER
jgi:hypothetical protein